MQHQKRMIANANGNQLITSGACFKEKLMKGFAKLAAVGVKIRKIAYI